ncbi:MAG: FecR domain-containing protein [Sedimenticola sp.]
MKTNGSIWHNKFLLIGLIAVAVVAVFTVYYYSGSGLKNAEQSFAKVKQAQGVVQKISGQGDTLSDIVTGDHLAMGESIKTGPDSSMTIEFTDQSIMMISENSRLSMNSLYRSIDTGETDTVVRLDTGSAESRVTKAKGFRARYQVITPALQLAVRGTVFVVNVDGVTGTTRSMVMEGTVTASGGGKDVDLSAGHGTVAEPGKPPSEPRAMLDAPVLKTMDSLIRRLPLHLVWEPAPNVSRYHLQLLTGSSFENLIHDKVYSANEAFLDDLPDADYKVRLRAIDEQGIEGKNGAQQFTLDAHPIPPEIQSPKNGDIIKRKKARFLWTNAPEANSYLFQVSDSKDFSKTVSRVNNLLGTMKGISVRLAPGEYFWRIASINEAGEQGPFSEARRFSVAARSRK